jgi:hypothetical protein
MYTLYDTTISGGMKVMNFKSLDLAIEAFVRLAKTIHDTISFDEAKEIALSQGAITSNDGYRTIGIIDSGELGDEEV